MTNQQNKRIVEMMVMTFDDMVEYHNITTEIVAVFYPTWVYVANPLFRAVEDRICWFIRHVAVEQL